MFLECWPRLCILSKDQAWTQGPSTCTHDCLRLGPQSVSPEKNNSFLTDFILQQGAVFSQPAARRHSLSAKRPLYGSPHCHVDPNTFFKHEKSEPSTFLQRGRWECHACSTSTTGPVKQAKEKLCHHCVLSFSLCRFSPAGSREGKATQEECEVAIRKAQHS